MVNEATRGVLRDIHTLYTLGTMGGRTDAELLERFLARGESDAEDAFATLVTRHGPMVLGVCRRMLPASHDAEDAFQATFLVLARRAASIVRKERVASWLYSVAVRTGQAARRRVARHRAAERRLMNETSEAKLEPTEDREDLLPILDEELNRLPHRYRVALVACELEGKPRREAALQLGIPEGTLSAHLARGRKLLREQLERRGVNLGVGPIAGLAGPLLEKAIPERLIGPTVRAALVDSSGAGATAGVTTAASSLAEGVLKIMFLARLSLVAAALTTAALGTATAVALGWSSTAAESPKADSAPAGPVGKAAAAKDRFGDPLPEGAVARLGSIRFRGGDRPVNAMRFSPDGQTLLTVSEDFLVRVWETKSGRLLHQFLAGSGRAFSRVGIAFSPDGKQIAFSGLERPGDEPAYYSVRLVVDAATGKEVRRLPVRARDSDLALAFTPDGKSLISLAHSGMFRVEEITSGVELLHREFPRNATGPALFAPRQNTGSVLLSPDGKLVAIWTGGNTRKLYLWDWQGATEPREVKVPRQKVGHLVFSPDGTALLACGDLEPFVYEWEVATGDLKHEITLRDDITLAGLALTPDGQTIAVSDSGNERGNKFRGAILLLERATGKLVRELPTPGAQAVHVVFSSDGRWLSASGEVGVRVWDWRTGEEVGANSLGHQNEITQIATAPGGLIASASEDHTVRIWDATTGIERQRLVHRDGVRAIAVSPDGRFLASSSPDNSVRLWDISNGKEVYNLPVHGLPGSRGTVGFTPDGRRFLSYGDDLYLRIWDVRTGRALTENAALPPGVARAGDVDRALAQMMMLGLADFTRDGQHLVVAQGGSFQIFETATGRVEKSVGGPGGFARSLAVAPDGSTFAATFAISGWRSSIQRNLPQWTTPNHHQVYLFELPTGRLVRELELPTDAAGPVAFSTDGKLLAIGFGRGRGEVHLIDLATWETVAVLTDFGSAPHAMAFSVDGKSLITALYDGTALVWDLARVLGRGARKDER
jgi:RNA polymerase sigma factor (sigma-70 family)